MHLPEPDLRLEVCGRSIAVDDRGDPAGAPVLYVHGTPDSRLARHPDDSIVVGLNIRLIAADRPGIGGSDVAPAATPTSVADDLVAVLDHLGIDRAAVFAWSSGSIPALALAGSHPDRVASVTLVAPLIPADAYSSPGVLDGSDDSRRLFAEHLAGATPGELGRELAMWLVPPEIDEPTARAVLADTLAALDHIPGAGVAMVAALRASVAQGMTGLEREIAAQAIPLGLLLDRITAPVHVHVGDADTVTPPAMARWLAERLGAALRIHPGAGHALAITHWADLLAALSLR